MTVAANRILILSDLVDIGHEDVARLWFGNAAVDEWITADLLHGGWDPTAVFEHANGYERRRNVRTHDLYMGEEDPSGPNDFDRGLSTDEVVGRIGDQIREGEIPEDRLVIVVVTR